MKVSRLITNGRIVVASACLFFMSISIASANRGLPDFTDLVDQYSSESFSEKKLST